MDILAIAVTKDGTGRIQLNDQGGHFALADVEVATGYRTNPELFYYDHNIRAQVLLVALEAFHSRLIGAHFGGEQIDNFSILVNPSFQVDEEDGYFGVADDFEIAFNFAVEEARMHAKFDVRTLVNDPVFQSAVKSLKESTGDSAPVTIALFLRGK